MGRAATPRESLPHTLPRWPASPDPGPGQVPRKARQAQWHGVHACGCSQLRVTVLVGATAAVGTTGSLRADTIC
eukprot:scaffold9039_cov115-Isochrysis_galbana.AAC.1